MLACCHGVALPADTAEGLRVWYTFTDFAHFIQVYRLVSACIRTPDDIELIAREFLAGQAAQNIRYTEVTYTAYTHYLYRGMAFADQLAALNRARAWAAQALGVRCGIVIDIDRGMDAAKSPLVADWAIAAAGDGVVALGLGGDEYGNPPEKTPGRLRPRARRRPALRAARRRNGWRRQHLGRLARARRGADRPWRALPRRPCAGGRAARVRPRLKSARSAMSAWAWRLAWPSTRCRACWRPACM